MLGGLLAISGGFEAGMVFAVRVSTSLSCAEEMTDHWSSLHITQGISDLCNSSAYSAP